MEEPQYIDDTIYSRNDSKPIVDPFFVNRSVINNVNVDMLYFMQDEAQCACCRIKIGHVLSCHEISDKLYTL